jgi:mannosyltransferase OCH1-like enzyme
MILTKIPRNIFQTWSTKNISANFNMLSQTWREKNPNYAYFIYDDDECKQFIQKNFDETVYNAYIRIIPGAFKADLWRYCILYIYGGVYVDMDTICLEQIDKFLNENIEFMTPIDLNNCPYYGKYNLFNCFIASIPKHPILELCINKIVYNVENNIVPFSNLDFTGPGLLGQCTNNYLNLDPTSSFIGKEGMMINNIHLLKFNNQNEIVENENGLALFQNKNGNEIIKTIYDNEIKKVKHIDWGTCKNPIQAIDTTKKSEPTIITMFYKIRDKESSNSECLLNHQVDRYLKYANEFILNLSCNLILFTDSDDIIEYIKNKRKEKLHIFNIPFEETYYYKHLHKLTDLQNKFNILNGHKDHETPMYIILNNNKFYFMEKAIELNPFNSNHFIWIDFGINHVAKNTEKINEWIFRIPDKIKQLCINPYIEDIDNKIMFQNIYHHMAGGLFSGSKDNLLKYCNLFKQKTEQIYLENWYQIDEAVMTMVQRENPDLFNLYYGDYTGIISNYLSPIHNIDLILRGSQKCIDNNKTKIAFDILCYCNNYFDNNKHDSNVLDFIQQHIIVDYYNNDKKLLMNVIDLINYVQYQISSDTIKDFLQRNATNLSYYKNSNLINF